MLCAAGFDANRISGSIVMEGIEQDGNHGSVLVRLDGVDYLADAQLASFRVLALVPGEPASTGDGLHDIRAVPVADGFDVQWYPGSNRQTPLIMRPNFKLGAVDHDFFVAHYALSTLRQRNRSPFNDALFIARRFPDSIVVIGRGNRIDVCGDNTAVKTEISREERDRMLIEELGISEEAVNAIPPDE